MILINAYYNVNHVNYVNVSVIVSPTNLQSEIKEQQAWGKV